MSIYRNQNSYKAEVWINSKKVKTKSGFRTKKEASDWLIKFKSEFSAGGHRHCSAPKTFEELCRRYRDVHLPTIKSGTARRYIIDLERRIEPYFRFYKLQDILPGTIDQFRSSLIASKLAPKSINNCTDLLAAMLRKAVDWGWLGQSPVKIKRLTTDKAMYEWWDSKEVVNRFLNGAKRSPYFAAYMLALNCGLRLGEVVGLSKQDISFDMGTIRVHRQWLDKEKRYGPTKNSRERFIKFHPGSLVDQVLRKAVAASTDPEVIFVTKSGRRIGSRNLSGGRFNQLVEKLELPPLTFHGLRHTFASWYMIEHGDIWSLMGILGHSSIKTTMRYAHVSSHHQRVPNFDWGFNFPPQFPPKSVLPLKAAALTPQNF